jgi:hypothetical protein
LGAYAFLQGRSVRVAAAVSLPAAAGFGLWSAHNLRDLGVVHFLDAGSWVELSLRRIVGDTAAYLSFLCGATASPLLYLFATRRRHDVLGMAAFGGFAVAASFGAEYAAGEQVALAFFVASGFCALASMRVPRTLGGEGRDDLFLLAMVAVPLLSQIVLNIFASARSLLIALPFLVLALVRRLEVETASPVRLRTVIGAGIGLTAAVALAVAIADLRYAEAAREVARRAATHRPATGAAWLTGEWGFRLYLEREGFVPVQSSGQGVRAGDVLVVPDVPSPAGLAPTFVSRLALVDTIESGDRFPIKLMSFEAHAGFYSNFWGLLPFSLSRTPLERARVFTVGGAP